MPYHTKWEDNGVVREYFGHVDSSEVLEADREFYEDSRSDASTYQIADFSNATPGVVDDSHIIEIAGFDIGASITIPNLKIALVASDQYVKALCQKYIDLSLVANKTWEFMIFEDMESARDWVSL